MMEAAAVDRMRCIIDCTILPVLTWMGHPYDKPPAAALLAAIAYTESDCRWRRQQPGPARSWWQIEPATALDTLRRHRLTAGRYWKMLLLPTVTTKEPLGPILEWSEAGACVLARMLLWHRLPEPLPRLVPYDVDTALAQYLRAWRPGKPHPDRFRDAWPDAVATVKARFP